MYVEQANLIDDTPYLHMRTDDRIKIEQNDTFQDKHQDRK